MAVDDDYIRSNPSDGVLKELKQSHIFKTEKHRGLTKPEQELLLNFLKKHPIYNHWYPIFAVMIGTGPRVGELAGLAFMESVDLNTVDAVLVTKPGGFRIAVYRMPEKTMTGFPCGSLRAFVDFLSCAWYNKCRKVLRPPKNGMEANAVKTEECPERPKSVLY